MSLWCRVVVVVVTSLMLGACADAETPKRTGFPELYVPNVRAASISRDLDAATGTADSVVSYTCNGREGSMWISTSTRSAFQLGPDEPTTAVTVRGHQGSLAFVDAGDPYLTWEEAPGVWVQVATEDFGLSKERVLGLAASLRERRWHRGESGNHSAVISGCPYFLKWD